MNDSMKHSDKASYQFFQEREGLSIALEKALREELHCPERQNVLRYTKFSTWKRQKDGSWA